MKSFEGEAGTGADSVGPIYLKFAGRRIFEAVGIGTV
ncbi:hypothetical protein Pan189_07460 [Stratiformator vulcanicus]|uniref:Uncharacterized protein n=1 Tax=Stratiformator vulcanicus TaxID=2527980 RepID=A0A517QXT8_9PLAN|nr:hypothetical protein Pan189_07460 [Stratiformator vulcanicus]